MFPGAFCFPLQNLCFPRVRGDVPLPGPTATGVPRFSPRARGCSGRGPPGSPGIHVFPACAGMFLACRADPNSPLGFPRVRGDVPFATKEPALDVRFSPRARGCSHSLILLPDHPNVFPACAGMFRWRWRQKKLGRCFPRVRGDVPRLASTLYTLDKFSPRARGCSDGYQTMLQGHGVFPACAGMFLKTSNNRARQTSFPRVRGDVPKLVPCEKLIFQFSPRARGCSALPSLPPSGMDVFPACAGMFRTAVLATKIHSCFPRVRGDVPPPAWRPPALVLFSPRARGCSVLSQARIAMQRVFPACAGMFRSRPTTKRPVRLFSPRARGCSLLPFSFVRLRIVFPACAGMFRFPPRPRKLHASFPRVRGDVPSPNATGCKPKPFSPRARGCSLLPFSFVRLRIVFPACAGMFP